MARHLDTAATRAFYDRFGAKQDGQAFYEDAALSALIAGIAPGTARNVFEFGCGTGRFAERLLDGPLPADVLYTACDISTTMVGLARKRLARFGARVSVRQTHGPVDFAGDGPFDRLLVTYVLDILSPDAIAAFLHAAAAAVTPGGLLGSVSLTRGETLPTRAVSTLWSAVNRLSPALVGGCHPLELARHIDPSAWLIRSRAVVSGWGVPSEVLICERRGAGKTAGDTRHATPREQAP